MRGTPHSVGGSVRSAARDEGRVKKKKFKPLRPTEDEIMAVGGALLRVEKNCELLRSAFDKERLGDKTRHDG